MKRFLVLLAALVLAATASAQRDYESVDPSGQTVTFWHQHTGIRQDMLASIVDTFNATNPYGITVVQENQGGYGDIFNKMLVLLGTADVPNLVVAYQNQAATYQVVDGLIDLWPLVRSAEWGYSEEELADFFPGFLQSDVNPTFGNALLGFPPNRSMEMMYYNIDWLAELGFDGPPTTPEAFAEVARASNYFPVRASVADDLGDYFEQDPAYGAAFGFLEYGIAEPPVPGYDFVRNLIAGEMAAIFEGADVQATLAAANVEANEILADQLSDID